MNLNDLREGIDNLDEKIIRLLNRRAKISGKIGELKRRKGQLVYAPDREQAVLRRLQSLNRGPVKRTSLEAIYREIMSSSLSLEKSLAIAYLGPEFTFTHQASIKKFGKSILHVPCEGIPDIFAEVANGRCDYGVAPVENSTEGAIYHTLDSFIETDLKICSEVVLRIQLELLTKEKSLSKIRKVYSNPAVFGQCRQWLESHLPGVELVSESSTAHSAQIAACEKGVACIASRLAAEPNGLSILGAAIQDSASNVTRFLVLSREFARPTKNDKTSLVMSIMDRPGALQKVLEPFRKRGINLTKIESRPSKIKQWDYYFFVDLEGHVEDARVQSALESIRSECGFLKVLGSYPRAGAIA